MNIKNKAKIIAYNFFDNFEVASVNYAMRKHFSWKLKHHFALETDSITPSFKKEIFQYWRRYTNKIKLDWHKYYSSRNGIYDVRYIPDDLYYTVIDQHFNSRKYSWGVMNKNYFSLWFPEAKQPVIVIRKINGFYYDNVYNIISQNEALEKCLNTSQLIIKPSVGTGGGKGIKFWKDTDGFQDLKGYLSSAGSDFIVQEIIIQHDNLKKIHPNSINTIRVATLLFKDKVHILSTILRMGINGSRVDNASAGGITCGVKETGQLKDKAYSVRGIEYKKHPQGFNFCDGAIPSFEKIKTMVVKQQEKMANFRMISWDIAVGIDGEPILIEANLRLGDLGIHQLNNGPFFGELTDEVLEEVFGRK